MDKRWIKVIRRWAATLLLLLPLPLSSPGGAGALLAAASQIDSPNFAVAEYRFDVHCTSPFTAMALISWQTSSEENVTGYKVHRTLLDSPEENRWVNRFPIAAMGSGVEYHVIDSQAVPGKVYRYRVYGFDESGRLSLATNLTLAERMQPSCSYVPLVYAAESVPGD